MQNTLQQLLREAIQIEDMISSHADADTLAGRVDAFLADLTVELVCEVPREELAPIFHRRFQLTVDDLRELSEVAIPLAIIRELVARHNLILHKSIHPNWSRFAALYRQGVYA